MTRVAMVLFATALAAACTADPLVRKQEHFDQGRRYFDEGRYEHAIIELRNAVELDGRFGEARKLLAEAYARSGDPARALEQYVRAADLLPGDVDVQISAGTLLLAARRAEDALARADAALRVNPDNIRAHLLRGNALAGTSSFDEALASIEEAIRIDPTRGATYTHLGAIELARGKREQAEAAFRRAVELDASSVASRLALGNFLWAVERAGEAEQEFRAALQLAPEHPFANRAMAAFLLGNGRPAEAEPYLKTLADTGDVRSVYALTDYYLRTGRPKEAIARLEDLQADSGHVPGISHRLARAYAVAGDTARAASIVDEILRANPKDADAHLLRGDLLLAQGKRDEAFEAVRAAVAADPDSAPAQFALGRMYSARGDADAAQAAFREVLRLNPRAAAAQVELSRLQLVRGDAAAAIRTAEAATRTQPDALPARLALVRSLLGAKELARAEREIDALRRDHPEVAAVHTQAGALWLQKGDTAAARAAFERALELDPGALDAVAGLITLDFRAGKPAAAIARAEGCLQQRSTPDVLLLVARTYISAGDLERAERILRRAIEADPDLLPPYALLGQLYMQQQKLDLARAEFDALAARQARPVAALTMSGIIAQAQGDLAHARRRFEEALAIDSQAAIAANNLAWILVESGEDLDAALQLAQTAMAAAPDVPEIMDTLGWVYYRKGLPELAVPLFERASQAAPNNPTYLHHLGLAHLEAGNTAAGRSALNRALAAGPDPETAAGIRRALAAATDAS